jgi:hypothetical protein
MSTCASSVVAAEPAIDAGSATGGWYFSVVGLAEERATAAIDDAMSVRYVQIGAFIIAPLVLSGCGELPPLPPPSPSENLVQNQIPKSQLQGMFDNIAAETKWNLDGDMLWGYFFTDADRTALERASEKLERQGYRYVDIFQPEDEGRPLPYFFLHVEKVETHSVDSLYNRNTDLEAFAKENGLDTYDGMDVGPVAPPQNAG